ncbi:MAG: hypothetical protein PHP37_03150 [Patescibacteria group bacterium]|nr:hypothetical protein [Patescibacteria group bacterium]
MKTKNLFSLSILSLFIFCLVGIAQAENGSTQGREEIKVQPKVNNTSVNLDGDKAQNKNQIQIQTQIQIPVQTQAQIQTQAQTKTQDQAKDQAQNQVQARDQNQFQSQVQAQIEARNEESKQPLNERVLNSMKRRSQVATAVSEMLKVADRNERLGEQIRVIAQNQYNNQDKIEAGLEKIQKRNRFLKFLFGADKNEINNVENLLSQNEEQLAKLEEIKNQFNNEADGAVIAEQINNLRTFKEEVDTDLGQYRKGFNLLGWLPNIFSRFKN